MLSRIPRLFVASVPLATIEANEGKYFDSNGVNVHYEGEGEAVVLIHGFRPTTELIG